MKNKTTKTKAKKQSPLANARPRDAVIREANRRLDKIEKAREVLTDQEKIIKATLVKGELGMKVGHFMAARKLRTMDGGERHSLLVAIREQFTAMKDTDKKQVNFLEVMEQEDKRALEDLKAHAVEMIVYERPLDPRNLGDHVDKSVNHGGKPRKDFRADFETIRLLIGIPMIIETAVEHYKSQGRKIDVQEVFVQSWRSHFTGTQKGGKEPTKARCVQLRWGFRNDNQADACGIWAFAKAHIDPQWSPVQGNGR